MSFGVYALVNLAVSELLLQARSTLAQAGLEGSWSARAANSLLFLGILLMLLGDQFS